MTASWMRYGSGQAHIVVKSGASGLTTACNRVIPKSAQAATTRWVEGETGKFYTIPMDGDWCAICERTAELAEM